MNRLTNSSRELTKTEKYKQEDYQNVPSWKFSERKLVRKLKYYI